jgi:hypothetical protein
MRYRVKWGAGVGTLPGYLFLAVSCLILCAWSAEAEHADRAKEVTMTSAPQWPKREYLVGVNYFAGWWRDLPNKYHVGGKDWRPAYPGRVAALGEYNEQRTMDREIVSAADHGVDFFQILWYPMDYEGPREPHQEHLNDAVNQFMVSPNAHKMRFLIEYCNHPPFTIDTGAKWETACRLWCRAMKHSSYLRIGGRPLFKIHTADSFFQQNNRDPSKVKAQLDVFRRIAREAGLQDPIIGAGGDTAGPTAGLYDFFATYMDVPNLPVREQLYPYSTLLKRAEDTWTYHASMAGKPYVPYLPAGWDPRPWHDPRPSFEMPARSEWIAALQRVRTALDRYPLLGFPDGKGGRQKAFTIYAWNEYGEGGIVAPTKGEGLMKLEGIEEVFSRSAPGKQ